MTLKICHGLVSGTATPQPQSAERRAMEPQPQALASAVSTEAVRTTFTASSQRAVQGDRLANYFKAKDLAFSVASRLKQEDEDKAHSGLDDKRVETVRRLS